MAKVKATKAEIEEAKEKLRKWLPRGSTVFCIVRKVAPSGMSRNISLVFFEHDAERGEIRDYHPTYNVAKVLGWSLAKGGGNDALQVAGCGMDMCFHTVYELSSVLYGDGYALKHRTL